MPKRGTKLSTNRPQWVCFCWVCGNEFTAIRSTAMMCSAKCKKQRSRYFAEHGEYPPRHRNAFRSKMKRDGKHTYFI